MTRSPTSIDLEVAVMHRAIARSSVRKAWLAELVGKTATVAGTLARTIPGAGGALITCFGFGMVYRPLFFIGIGLLLLVVDRRIP
jgi:hypothetical protein